VLKRSWLSTAISRANNAPGRKPPRRQDTPAATQNTGEADRASAAAHHNLARCFDTVNLENVLLNIQTNWVNFYIGRLPNWWLQIPPWHIAMPAVKSSTASESGS
jgi:hypothetical protein